MKKNGHKTLKTISDLSPDTLNANKGTPRGLQMVEDSLRNYGAGRSILADKQGRIIAGNKTLQSASDIDLPIRVIETDGKELVVVQRTDLDLNDPKARELALADNRAGQVGLEWDADVLAQLKDEGVELSGMFTEKELAAILPQGESKDAEPRIDKAAELQQKWQVGRVTNDDRSSWLPAFDASPSVVAYVWHASASAVQFAVDLMSAGFEIRNQIIWAKNNIVIGRGHYHWKHEPCWYGVRKGGTSHWVGDRTQATVWDIDKPMRSETGHSTQKPLECMARPIRNHEGDIYDPFVGSGTTLVAAENLNRTCYAMEISPEYCAVVLERMTTAFPHLEIKREEVAVAA